MDDLVITRLATQLQSYLPAGTEKLCALWLVQNRVELYLPYSRKTKLGDFRSAHRGKPPRISVNRDLHPLQFLVTFTHEIAHAQIWNRYRREVAPHGPEWKLCYREHLKQLLALDVLDLAATTAIRAHSVNPRASSSADCHIQKLTNPAAKGPLLDDLNAGDVFTLSGGKTFRALKKLRKYWRCEELSTKRLYRVHGSQPVTIPSADHALKL